MVKVADLICGDAKKEYGKSHGLKILNVSLPDFVMFLY